MTSAPYARELLVAELAVQRASILTKTVLHQVNRGELSKADSSPVTIADFAAQALIISAVHHAFPADRFIGEECADVLRQDAELRGRVWELVSTTNLDDAEAEGVLATPASVEEMLQMIDLGGQGLGGAQGRHWMLDPVDGTATFIRGEQYAVSLALVEDGREVVGVLGCPNLSLQPGKITEQTVDRDGLGLMLSAVRSQGANMRSMGTGTLQPSRSIETLSAGPVDLTTLHFVDSTLSDTWWHTKVRQIAERLGAPYPGTELWSSHMRYAAQIVGGGDVQMRIPPLGTSKTAYVWDHAGAQLIFTEVGGKITDIDGKEIDFGAGRELSNNRGIIAAKAGVHGKVLELVNEVIRPN